MKDQLKLGVILSYLSTGLNMLIQLIYTPIMIRLLGQSEYGLYTLVGSVVSYLSLFSLGFTGAYLRFYSKRKAQNNAAGIAELNGMFLSLFMVMSAIAFICGMILVQFPQQLFGSNLTDSELKTAQILMTILVVNIALTFPASLLDSIISAHEKFLFQRIVTLVGVICNPLLALPLLLMGYGSVAIVSVTTAITVTKLVINQVYCLKVLKIEFNFHGFDFQVLREIAAFSFFLFLNMIIDQINWSVDKFILGRVSGTKAVAIYGVGAQINSLVMTFSTAISSVFAPRVNRIAAENSTNRNKQFTALFTKVGRIQYLILMLIVSGFVIFGKYFITNIYSTAEYSSAYPVALLLIIPAFIPLIQNLGIEIQRAVNKHQIRSVIYLVMAVLNVVISIPLAKAFGPVGSALGTAIGLILANGIVMNIYYQKGIGMDMIFFWKNIFSLTKGMIIPGILGFFIIKAVVFDNIFSYIVAILIYTLFYCVSMWMLGMNSDEKNMVLQPTHRIKWKLRSQNDKN